MSDTPINEPLQLRAGDTWKWRREDLSDYPAPTWVLTYQFKKENSGGNFTIVATASGTSHAVSVAKATTAAYSAGRWHWQAYADNGTERYLADSGVLEVLADFAAAGNTDARSHVKKVLDALEATLEGKASLDQKSMMIGTRRVDRFTPEELLVWRDKYRAEYNRELDAERLKNGLGLKNRLLVRG
jgi:hypothetical protein